MNDAAQVAENLRVADHAEANGLTPGQLTVYGAARAALRSRIKADCTACRYCQPCPEGVQIPELLAALDAASMWNTRDPWMTGYTRTVGKPESWIQCGKCEEICPQGLPIRDLLKETARTFAR